MSSLTQLGLFLFLGIQSLDLGRMPGADGPVTPALIIPGGIASPDGHMGFFGNANGGIDAVDLRSGRLMWQTYEAQVPLLLANDYLFAQAGIKRNRLRLLVFDLRRHGECVLESDPVVLPRWVVTGSAPAHSFAARWSLEKKSLRLDWKARTWYDGPHATAEREAAARHQAAGVARIDLETGGVTMRSTTPTTDSKRVEPVPQLEKLAIRWQGQVGTTLAALVLEEVEEIPVETTKTTYANGGDSGFEKYPSSSSLSEKRAIGKKSARERQQKFVLRKWDQVKEIALPEKELLRGRRLLVKTTMDGNYLCLRDSDPSPDVLMAQPGRTRPQWTLVALANGEKVATLAFPAGTQAVAVLHHRAYCLVASTIRATPGRTGSLSRTLYVLDLKTGQTLWRRSLADRNLSS